jgi:HSP20 family molecular chaperone IbpA
MTKEIIMAEKTVDTPDTQERATQPEDTRTRERYVTPPVEIYEMPEGLVVIADVPGVTPEHFDVRVDNHILTIRGQVAHALPGEPTYREYELVNYFRQFELSAKVDESTIAADLQHGVLTLTLSKVVEAQPRQIAVAVR